MSIDDEEFYDCVLAHSPEFVAGRKAAEERFARGEYGEPLGEVLAGCASASIEPGTTESE